MPTRITVTKVASAYIEIEHDTQVSINADFISKIISVPESAEIGAAVLFFFDGTTMNISETAYQIKKQVEERRPHYFQKMFSKN
jgi:hypothetical protein